MCDNQAVTRSISALSFHHHCPKSVVLQCYASKSDSDSVKKKKTNMIWILECFSITYCNLCCPTFHACLFIFCSKLILETEGLKPGCGWVLCTCWKPEARKAAKWCLRRKSLCQLNTFSMWYRNLNAKLK